MDSDAIHAAARRLEGIALRTPLLESQALNARAGRRVLVKAECLQHTGSFKFRGGRNALESLAPDVRARGVIAYSSGNHAQGVAAAGAALGAPVVIVMPSDAPLKKQEGTRALGAEIVFYDRFGEDRDAIGARLAEERGLTLVKPFDDPTVIAGQGTVGLEIAEQARAAGVEEADVIVCAGGGGLLAGVALACAAEAPGLRTRPAEPTAFDDIRQSLAAGRIVANAANAGSICDAILTRQPGDLTFPILHRLCGPGLAVSDDDCLMAMAVAFGDLRIVLEPGGAVALAAALVRPEEIEGDAVIVVASGGNVEAALFAKALSTAGRAA